MEHPLCLRLWIDHKQFGCGRRDFIAVVGRKWVTLVAIASGEHARITKSDYEAAARFAQPVVGRSIKKRLRRNAATFGNENGAVKDVLARL